MLTRIESVITPISFGLLFLLMLLYWGQVALYSHTKYKNINSLVFYTSFISLTSLLGLRWVESGHFPLSNLYESLLFLSWSFLLSQSILQSNVRDNSKPRFAITNSSLSEQSSDKAALAATNNISLHDLLGVILSPLALVSYGFAFLNLPKEMQKATSLVPALQSNWLMMHVTVMILSYAALFCGSLLSMAFLLVHFLSKNSDQAKTTQDMRLLKQSSRNSVPTFTDTPGAHQMGEAVTSSFASQTAISSFAEQGGRSPFLASQTSSTFSSQDRLLQKQNQKENGALCELFDSLSYRMVGLGFPLLTVGILSGAVWANAAWGSYWSWDPKETWALITWLVFAIYLHARLTKGWRGVSAAWISTLGFFVLWFCYLGVNLIGTGLHSYGWFHT